MNKDLYETIMIYIDNISVFYCKDIPIDKELDNKINELISYIKKLFK